MKNIKKYGNTTILNLEEVVLHKPSNNSVLIRIGDTRNEFLNLKYEDLYHDILEFEFYDFEYRNGLPSNIVLFDAEKAELLLNFLNKNKDRELVVHCHAGVSRSAAVAICYHILHNNKETIEEMINSKMFVPNYEVLKYFNKLVPFYEEEELKQKYSIYSEEHFVYEFMN